MNILLVDDDASALSEAKELFRAVLPEAAVFAFSDGEAALSCAEETAFDIAVLETTGTPDGITLARRLQERRERIDLIFCTASKKYTMEALSLYCSAYLIKPLTPSALRSALAHLRYSVLSPEKRIRFQCFGSFEAYFNGKPIHFKYSKTKELLAYLVDRNGAEAATREIMAVIFETDKESYFANLRMDLLGTFRALGESDIILHSRGKLALNKDAVSCDYFDFLEGKNSSFRGEYMSQYSLGEYTCAMLKNGIYITNKPKK